MRDSVRYPETDNEMIATLTERFRSYGVAVAREFLKAMDGPWKFDVTIGLLNEEANELVLATRDYFAEHSLENRAAVLKELADCYYIIFCLAVIAQDEMDKMDELDRLLLALLTEALDITIDVAMDAIDVDYGLLFAAIDIVHAANLSKLGADGKPVKREDGKVLKGPNYQAPDLTVLLVDAEPEREAAMNKSLYEAWNEVLARAA